MWSFVNTLGSHSFHTKLKTHYSEQLHSYNSPLVDVDDVMNVVNYNNLT